VPSCMPTSLLIEYNTDTEARARRPGRSDHSCSFRIVAICALGRAPTEISAALG
jgi:hypothetical protein